MILLEGGREGCGDVSQCAVKAHCDDADVNVGGVLSDDWELASDGEG